MTMSAGRPAVETRVPWVSAILLNECLVPIALTRDEWATSSCNSGTLVGVASDAAP
jgi:hypothetical protein